MNLLLAVAENAHAWHDAFATRLPEAKLARWPDERPPEVDYAAVWKPDPEAFRRVAVRKAIFNLGAGVVAAIHFAVGDRVPEGASLVDLEDPPAS